MDCPVCGMRMDDDDALEVTLETRTEPVKVCEVCATNIAEALFQNRTVTTRLCEGVITMEVVS